MSDTAGSILSATAAGIGLANGGNTASAPLKGWRGTVHGLTAADKATNFRKSLDRQRAAAHPQAAATGGAILDATVDGVLRINAPRPDEHTIKAFPDLKKPDRQGEWEDRLTRMEAELAKLRHLGRELESPFREVFIVAQDGSNRAQWKEQTVQDADLVDFQDGRKCLSSGDSGQLITLGDKKAVLEIHTGSTRAYIDLTSAATYLVQVVDILSYGAGFYQCFVVSQQDVDIDTSANLFDVVNDIFVTETFTGHPSILVNMMEASYNPGPKLALYGYYLAKRGRSQSTGAPVFICESHAIEYRDILSGCPAVGEDGVSLDFPTINVGVVQTGTATTCSLSGTNCASG